MFCNVPVENIIDSIDVTNIYDIPINYYNQHIDEIILKQFGLPIKKVKDEDTFFGSLNEVAILTDPEPLFYYRNISLSAKPTEITKLAYTHEIAHSQLNHIKGIIKDFYNTEVISILLESIHALEADPTERLLYVHDTNRLKDLYEENIEENNQKYVGTIQKLLVEGYSKNNEEMLRRMVDDFKNKASESAALAIEKSSTLQSTRQDELKNIISDAINNNIPELGLKSVIDSQKKKILISHTYRDKGLADAVFNMLLFNNVPAEDILYTSCDDEICRIPEGVSIYNYLRDFFVESYSRQKIFVLFITSDNTPKAWGAMTEIGASWITQIDNKIFNIPPFRPQHPLNDEALWHSTNRDENDELSMDLLNADIFCQKIEHICDELGYSKRVRTDNKNYLMTLVTIN